MSIVKINFKKTFILITQSSFFMIKNILTEFEKQIKGQRRKKTR